MDVEGDEALAGKALHKDAAAGKATRLQLTNTYYLSVGIIKRTVLADTKISIAGLGNAARLPRGRAALLDLGGAEILERLAEGSSSALVRSHVDGALRQLRGEGSS